MSDDQHLSDPGDSGSTLEQNAHQILAQALPEPHAPGYASTRAALIAESQRTREVPYRQTSPLALTVGIACIPATLVVLVLVFLVASGYPRIDYIEDKRICPPGRPYYADPLSCMAAMGDRLALAPEVGPPLLFYPLLGVFGPPAKWAGQSRLDPIQIQRMCYRPKGEQLLLQDRRLRIGWTDRELRQFHELLQFPGGPELAGADVSCALLRPPWLFVGTGKKGAWAYNVQSLAWRPIVPASRGAIAAIRGRGDTQVWVAAAKAVEVFSARDLTTLGPALHLGDQDAPLVDLDVGPDAAVARTMQHSVFLCIDGVGWLPGQWLGGRPVAGLAADSIAVVRTYGRTIYVGLDRGGLWAYSRTRRRWRELKPDTGRVNELLLWRTEDGQTRLAAASDHEIALYTLQVDGEANVAHERQKDKTRVVRVCAVDRADEVFYVLDDGSVRSLRLIDGRSYPVLTPCRVSGQLEVTALAGLGAYQMIGTSAGLLTHRGDQGEHLFGWHDKVRCVTDAGDQCHRRLGTVKSMSNAPPGAGTFVLGSRCLAKLDGSKLKYVRSVDADTRRCVAIAGKWRLMDERGQVQCQYGRRLFVPCPEAHLLPSEMPSLGSLASVSAVGDFFPASPGAPETPRFVLACRDQVLQYDGKTASWARRGRGPQGDPIAEIAIANSRDYLRTSRGRLASYHATLSSTDRFPSGFSLQSVSAVLSEPDSIRMVSGGHHVSYREREALVLQHRLPPLPDGEKVVELVRFRGRLMYVASDQSIWFESTEEEQPLWRQLKVGGAHGLVGSRLCVLDESGALHAFVRPEIEPDTTYLSGAFQAPGNWRYILRGSEFLLVVGQDGSLDRYSLSTRCVQEVKGGVRDVARVRDILLQDDRLYLVDDRGASVVRNCRSPDAVDTTRLPILGLRSIGPVGAQVTFAIMRGNRLGFSKQEMLTDSNPLFGLAAVTIAGGARRPDTTKAIWAFPEGKTLWLIDSSGQVWSYHYSTREWAEARQLRETPASLVQAYPGAVFALCTNSDRFSLRRVGPSASDRPMDADLRGRLLACCGSEDVGVFLLTSRELLWCRLGGRPRPIQSELVEAARVAAQRARIRALSQCLAEDRGRRMDGPWLLEPVQVPVVPEDADEAFLKSNVERITAVKLENGAAAPILRVSIGRHRCRFRVSDGSFIWQGRKSVPQPDSPSLQRPKTAGDYWRVSGESRELKFHVCVGGSFVELLLSDGGFHWDDFTNVAWLEGNDWLVLTGNGQGWVATFDGKGLNVLSVHMAPSGKERATLQRTGDVLVISWDGKQRRILRNKQDGICFVADDGRYTVFSDPITGYQWIQESVGASIVDAHGSEEGAWRGRRLTCDCVVEPDGGWQPFVAAERAGSVAAHGGLWMPAQSDWSQPGSHVRLPRVGGLAVNASGSIAVKMNEDKPSYAYVRPSGQVVRSEDFQWPPSDRLIHTSGEWAWRYNGERIAVALRGSGHSRTMVNGRFGDRVTHTIRFWAGALWLGTGDGLWQWDDESRWPRRPALLLGKKVRRLRAGTDVLCAYVEPDGEPNVVRMANGTPTERPAETADPVPQEPCLSIEPFARVFKDAENLRFEALKPSVPIWSPEGRFSWDSPTDMALDRGELCLLLPWYGVQPMVESDAWPRGELRGAGWPVARSREDRRFLSAWPEATRVVLPGSTGTSARAAIWQGEAWEILDPAQVFPARTLTASAGLAWGIGAGHDAGVCPQIDGRVIEDWCTADGRLVFGHALDLARPNTGVLACLGADQESLIELSSADTCFQSYRRPREGIRSEQLPFERIAAAGGSVFVRLQNGVWATLRGDGRGASADALRRSSGSPLRHEVCIWRQDTRRHWGWHSEWRPGEPSGKLLDAAHPDWPILIDGLFTHDQCLSSRLSAAGHHEWVSATPAGALANQFAAQGAPAVVQLAAVPAPERSAGARPFLACAEITAKGRLVHVACRGAAQDRVRVTRFTPDGNMSRGGDEVIFQVEQVALQAEPFRFVTRGRLPWVQEEAIVSPARRYALFAGPEVRSEPACHPGGFSFDVLWDFWARGGKLYQCSEGGVVVWDLTRSRPTREKLLLDAVAGPQTRAVAPDLDDPRYVWLDCPRRAAGHQYGRLDTVTDRIDVAALSSDPFRQTVVRRKRGGSRVDWVLADHRLSLHEASREPDWIDRTTEWQRSRHVSYVQQLLPVGPVLWVLQRDALILIRSPGCGPDPPKTSAR